MVVQHNISSLFAQNKLKTVTDNKSKASEQLSSGYRINRAADDVAGLTISEKMRWQIWGLQKDAINIQDGISLLETADGALSEVHGILDRMKELSIQAANDTNTTDDRNAIQEELDALTAEIDRIGSTTEFNTRKLFQGSYSTIVDGNGVSIPVGDIPFSAISLADISLENQPFTDGSSHSTLHLAASSSEDYGSQSWNLIFSNGGTSNSLLRVSYDDGTGNGTNSTENVPLSSMSVSNYQYDSTNECYSRTLSYTAANGGGYAIIQRISVGNHDATSQYYNISYELINNTGEPVAMDLLFDADTAYNNNDRAEGYYIGGQQVDNFCLYTSNPDYASQTSPYIYDMSTLNGSDGFSIVNTQAALQFSENIRWGSDAPDSFAITRYGIGTSNDAWRDFDNASSILGGSTHGSDLTFSLIWNRTVAANSSSTVSFQYGIMETQSDNNLAGVPITYDPSINVPAGDTKLWIQTGTTDQSGFFITIGKLNRQDLNIDRLSVASYDNAGDAIIRIDEAIEKVSKNRSTIGAQQNRLEHSKQISDNTEENTQSAESRIRDADLAKVMVAFSAYDIIQQAGQSMLAQGNQSKQKVLELLQ